MPQVLRPELIKARTVRTLPALIGGAAAVAALASAAGPPAQLRGSLHETTAYFISCIAVAVFAVVLGARSFTDEFRDGTHR